MRYRSQAVAYWYFAVAMILFGLQLVFGLLSAAKYLGPDPLLYILPFDVTKVIHTNGPSCCPAPCWSGCGG